MPRTMGVSRACAGTSRNGLRSAASDTPHAPVYGLPRDISSRLRQHAGKDTACRGSRECIQPVHTEGNERVLRFKQRDLEAAKSTSLGARSIVYGFWSIANSAELAQKRGRNDSCQDENRRISDDHSGGGIATRERMLSRSTGRRWVFRVRLAPMSLNSPDQVLTSAARKAVDARVLHGQRFGLFQHSWNHDSGSASVTSFSGKSRAPVESWSVKRCSNHKTGVDTVKRL